MNNYLINKIPKESTKWLRLVPFLILGGVVFTFNSTLELNYILRGYLVLLETQFGIIILYFLVTKLLRKTKKNINLK